MGDEWGGVHYICGVQGVVWWGVCCVVWGVAYTVVCKVQCGVYCVVQGVVWWALCCEVWAGGAGIVYTVMCRVSVVDSVLCDVWHAVCRVWGAVWWGMCTVRCGVQGAVLQGVP